MGSKIEFFLKAVDGKGVRAFVKQPNGFVGLADEVHKQIAPFIWLRFQSWLHAEGEDKLKKECLAKGELYLPEEEKPIKAVEAVELVEAVEEVEAAEIKPEVKKNGGSSKKKSKSDKKEGE